MFWSKNGHLVNGLFQRTTLFENYSSFPQYYRTISLLQNYVIFLQTVLLSLIPIYLSDNKLCGPALH